MLCHGSISCQDKEGHPYLGRLRDKAEPIARTGSMQGSEDQLCKLVNLLFDAIGGMDERVRVGHKLLEGHSYDIGHDGR